MKIKDIESPEFLKTLSIDECNKLSTEIRDFLINSISKTGGHLSSNLGVVELTIALHKVFNSPKDKIIFDVGHQSYVHKILTGRAKYFDSLRQYNGISGFQKRCESDHDCWEAGHSSTALSASLGMAVSRDLNNEDYHIIPFVGDGAIISGMSLEALNQIGEEKRNMIIIFNDNNMSISQNIGSLSKGFSRLRTLKSYGNVKKDIKSFLNKNDFGKNVIYAIKNVKEKFKKSVIDQGIFSELSLDYIGPVDGHNIRDLVSVLEAAKEHDGPIVIHVITKKGKGYVPCEKDIQGKWHGVSPFNINTGLPLVSVAEGFLSWSEVISSTLCTLAKKNKDIVAITPAMMCGSKLSNFFALYPDRSFDCGIAEDHAATFAAGLANSGKRPFLSIYSSFLQRSYDQINHDIGRMNLPVVIGVDRAGLVGEDGETHHGVFDISILRSIPNLIICQPKDAIEAQNLLNIAFNQTNPFIIRYPRGSIKYNKVTSFEDIKIGSWETDYKPNNIQAIVLTYGAEVDKVSYKVKNNNLPVMVINCRFFKPIDTKMIEYLCELNLPVICYETDILDGGLGSSILNYTCDHNMHLNLYRIGIHDQFIKHGALNKIRKEAKVDIDTLLEKIKELV
ncbi:MAG: 1-deoxy-D-xylulose-5-phosphate synthase [Anaerorhabdus sp.]